MANKEDWKNIDANVGVFVVGVRLFCLKSGYCSMRRQQIMDWGHRLLRQDLWSVQTHLHLLKMWPSLRRCYYLGRVGS